MKADGGKDAGLRLAARDADDVAVISAMLQDAIAPLKDLRYEPAERRFVAVVNRFKWEDAAATHARDGAYERVLCGLSVGAVRAARVQGIDQGERDRLLSLLAVAAETGPAGPAVVLTFAGGGSVRLEVERVAIVAEDLGLPWPTQWQPGHGADGSGGESGKR
ncbi:MAG: DUF2948 family protein [Alphaproteobacteria bacterium]|nr:DUF2948 family protein [Alphaproteobacteria bacterium]